MSALGKDHRRWKVGVIERVFRWSYPADEGKSLLRGNLVPPSDPEHPHHSFLSAEPSLLSVQASAAWQFVAAVGRIVLAQDGHLPGAVGLTRNPSKENAVRDV